MAIQCSDARLELQQNYFWAPAPELVTPCAGAGRGEKIGLDATAALRRWNQGPSFHHGRRPRRLRSCVRTLQCCSDFAKELSIIDHSKYKRKDLEHGFTCRFSLLWRGHPATFGKHKVWGPRGYSPDPRDLCFLLARPHKPSRAGPRVLK